jgi:non-ribosomal peptide synthetase component E (peptide arylation enzyme)
VISKDKKVDYLYYVGCAGSYDASNQKVVKDTLLLLKKAGVSFAVMGKTEKCNGDPIRRFGDEYSFFEIAIENIASAHPDLLAVACIAIAHPKWDERPLLVAVKKPNYIRSEQLLKEEIWQLFQGKMAKWCVPDEIIFIEEMPLTATGKIFKLKLRDLLKDFQFSN